MYSFSQLAAEINEQICIKTDSIKPEFAEPAVITPSDESKTIDEIVVSSPVPSQTEALIEKQQEEAIPAEPEPFVSQAEILTAQIEEPKPVEVPTETPKDIPVLTPLPIVPATPQEVKVEEKKGSITASGKKPIGNYYLLFHIIYSSFIEGTESHCDKLILSLIALYKYQIYSLARCSIALKA